MLAELLLMAMPFTPMKAPTENSATLPVEMRKPQIKLNRHERRKRKKIWKS